ncbi:hypothetical protein BDV93DRAFT_519010 [Ceratobasidium sp. AG-I]|nr:hypothetical protein BDV93DRAFT_519010 [Ceratobasidium sp. AG-I]
MHARSSNAPGPSSYTPQYKFNSSPAPSYDVLAPDAHGYASASAIGTTSARRRVGSGDDGLANPWGDSGPRASSSTTASVGGAVANGRTGLRSRSRSHSTSVHGNNNTNGAQTHPLQGTGSPDAGDTRPGLRRMLSSKDNKAGLWGFSDGWVEEEPEDVATPGEERVVGLSREMLVHKIQPKDSLAGVALRYGVSLADIRKANKLWSSDSIHLRSALYIPLTPNLKLGYSPNLIDLRTPGKERDVELSTEVSASADDVSSNTSAPANPAVAPDAPTIKHVPVSELSFFPPPTTSPQRKPSANRANTLPRGTLSPFASGHPLLFSPGLSSTSSPFFPSMSSQLSSSPSRGPGALSSLFSGIPLPDAAVATIQRLSFDSIAGGSLTPRAGSSTSDLSEQLLELNTLSTRPARPASSRPKRTIRTQPAPGPVMTVPRRSVEGDGGPSFAIDEDW